MLYDTWVTKDDGVARDIAVDKAVRGNHHIIADGDVSTYHGIDANPNFVSDCGTPLALASVLLPYRDSLVDVTIVSNPCPWINRYAPGMTYIQAVAYLCIPCYLYASFQAKIFVNYAPEYLHHSRGGCALAHNYLK